MSIVVVGSLNMDYILQVPGLPKRGETVFADGLSTAPGGKGANQAVASKRLGSHVHMVGRVGADAAGRALVACLEEAGVDISEVKDDSRESTGAAYITVAEDGTNTIVVNRGANFALEPSHVLDAERLIQDANVVVAQLETPTETVSQALKLARAHNTVTVLNPAPMVPLEPEILTLSDWLIPNETEAVSLLRLLGQWDDRDEERLRCDLTREFAMEAAGRLAEVTCAHVIITLGDKGCVYVGPFDCDGLAFPAWEVNTVDTTAAGDAFVGALACALDEDSGSTINVAKLVCFAQATAALATTKLGAQPSLPTRIEVEEFCRIGKEANAMGDNKDAPLLAMQGISKSFPGVKALDKVDFQLWPGEVHALVGENGAGKSTLIKILAGVYSMDSGQTLIEGKPADIGSPRQASKYGISVVHQEFTLVPQMTVAENIMLSDMPSRPGLRLLVDKKAMVSGAREILDDLGVDISVSSPVRSLTVAEQQIVEVAKALSRKTRILVMDEPTAALSNVEVERLFNVIQTLVSKGMAVVYISHKLDEVFRISDRLTVLRDGRVISSSPVSSLTRNEVVKQMVGRELTGMYDKPEVDIGKPVMEVRDLLLDPMGHGISFTAHEGEVLGIAGLMGAGQIKLARALFGIERVYGGEVIIKGKPMKISSPAKAVETGIGLVTENRKEEGLVQLLSVSRNITLTVLDAVSRMGVLSSRAEADIVSDKIRDLDIKTPSPKQIVMNLSGGNQQKVVLAKWLAVDPDVMIMCEPTRGIDVGAKAEIYRLIGEMARNGKAVLLISSEIPEIVGMSDKVVVMHSGKVVGELTGAGCTQEAVLRLATGGSAVGA